jgi:hypothetical protein
MPPTARTPLISNGATSVQSAQSVQNRQQKKRLSRHVNECGWNECSEKREPQRMQLYIMSIRVPKHQSAKVLFERDLLFSHPHHGLLSDHQICTGQLLPVLHIRNKNNNGTRQILREYAKVTTGAKDPETGNKKKAPQVGFSYFQYFQST